MTEPWRYAQYYPDVTAEEVVEKMKLFEEEFSKIPEEDAYWANLAREKCPELLTEDFMHQFLRCEVYRPHRAAKRFAKYWDYRVEIYGEEMAFKPLTMSESLRDDWVALTFGFGSYLAEVKDPMGRSIIYMDFTQQDRKKYTHASMLRSIWYFMHVVLENPGSRDYGVVMIGKAHGGTLSMFDKDLVRLLLDSLQNGIPVRLAAFHVFRPPTIVRVLQPLVFLLMSERLKKRVIFHNGSEAQAHKNLSIYGLEKEMLPKSMGGTSPFDFVEWLHTRKNEGK